MSISEKIPQISELWEDVTNSADPAEASAASMYSLEKLLSLSPDELRRLGANAESRGAVRFSQVCSLLAQRAKWEEASIGPDADEALEPAEQICRAYWLEGMAAFREAGRLDGHPMAGQRTAQMPARHGYRESVRTLATREPGGGGYDGFKAMVRQGMLKLTAEWFVGIRNPDLFDDADVQKARQRLADIGQCPDEYLPDSERKNGGRTEVLKARFDPC